MVKKSTNLSLHIIEYKKTGHILVEIQVFGSEYGQNCCRVIWFNGGQYFLQNKIFHLKNSNGQEVTEY
jgi:intein/homing endonuclease